MKKDQKKVLTCGGALETTGNKDTNELTGPKGKGRDILLTKSKRRLGAGKFTGTRLSLALIDIARENNDEKFRVYASRCYNCIKRLVVSDDKAYGLYCRTRMCPICQGIRKAKMIELYKPIIKNWSNPHFVTLTVKSCRAYQLRGLIKNQLKAFNLITRRHYRRWERGKSNKLIVLRCHECNYNPKRGWYNPHFHCIVPDKETAEILKAEWKAYWGQTMTNEKGQDIKEITDFDHQLKETIKYGSKIFTNPEMKKGLKAKNHMIYVRALYIIMKAFDGIKLVSPIGFSLPEQLTKKEQVTPAESKKVSTLIYMHKVGDWVNPETGSMLTRFTPTLKHEWMMKNIDKDSF